MQSHSTGPIIGSRNGSISVQQTFVLNPTNQPVSTQVKRCTIPASTDKPQIVKISAIVSQPFTTGQVYVGTVPGTIDNLIVGGDLTVNNATYAGGNTITTQQRVFKSNTDVYVRLDYTGSVGEVILVVEAIEVNTADPSVN